MQLKGGTFDKASFDFLACVSTQRVPRGQVVGTDGWGGESFTECTLLGPEGPDRPGTIPVRIPACDVWG